LEFHVPFQHKYGYIRDNPVCGTDEDKDFRFGAHVDRLASSGLPLKKHSPKAAWSGIRNLQIYTFPFKVTGNGTILQAIMISSYYVPVLYHIQVITARLRKQKELHDPDQ